MEKKFVKHRLMIKDILKLKKGQKIDAYLENNINKEIIFEKKIKYDTLLDPIEYLKQHKAELTYLGEMKVRIKMNGKTKEGKLSISQNRKTWRYDEPDKNGDIEKKDESG